MPNATNKRMDLLFSDDDHHSKKRRHRFRVVTGSNEQEGLPYFQDGTWGYHELRLVSHAQNGHKLLAVVEDKSADVVLVSEHLSGIKPVDIASRLKGQNKVLPIFVLVCDTVDLDTWQLVEQSALDLAIERSFSMLTLTHRIADRYERLLHRSRQQSNNGQVIVPTPPSDQGESGGSPPAGAPGAAKAQTYVFYSPKGGTGKTTLATNTAVGLAKYTDREVVLLDFDSNFGDVSAHLDVLGTKNIFQWQSVSGALNRHDVLDLLVPHRSGLYVLPANDTQIEATQVNETLVTKVITELKRHFDIIICDCEPALEDATIVSFENADNLIVVSTPDPITVKTVAKIEHTLETLNIEFTSLDVVINRWHDLLPIAKSNIEDYLPWPIMAYLPEDDDVTHALYEGELAIEQKKSVYRQTVLDWMEAQFDLDPIQAGGHKDGLIGLFGRLLPWG